MRNIFKLRIGMMNRWQQIADYLWGPKASGKNLFIFTIFILFTFLGTRDLWTQEHRWAEIVSGMFYRHDFLHPYLGNVPYYDKPLLSYWLIALMAKLWDGLNTWSLRIPTAISGLLATFAIYQIGFTLRGRGFGFLCAWMLLTTGSIVFWARVSSADMMNIAGVLCALAWYLSKRTQTRFYDYVIFYLILAVTSLCKGLLGVVLPLLCVLTDLLLTRSFKRHFNVRHVLALLFAGCVYFIPFLLSLHLGEGSYQQNGLYLVYRENILRYFHPFDHQDPFYIYFIYLPLYLMPWTLFFLPALCGIKKRWASLSIERQWMYWCFLILFMFFTLSGSRRDYYVLSLIPFAILVTADYAWDAMSQNQKRIQQVVALIIVSYMSMFMFINALPAWYSMKYGANRFVAELKKEASMIMPWERWKIVTLDAESKVTFYFHLPPDNSNYHIKGNTRHEYQSVNKMLSAFPLLNDPPKQTIFVTRKRYQPYLDQILKGYRVVEVRAFHLSSAANKDDTIAYVPVSS